LGHASGQEAPSLILTTHSGLYRLDIWLFCCSFAQYSWQKRLRFRHLKHIALSTFLYVFIGFKTVSNNQQESITSSSANITKPKAYAIHDQRTVTQTLKKFNPKGSDRAKLVTLRDEIKKLKVNDNPIAFCFLLRSMFEISANIYSTENNIPKAKTNNGKTLQNTLQQQLNAVTLHLTSNNSNPGMVKTLHGANSELSKSAGLLSVTSMNQLVHNPSFSIAPHDIYTLFNNVYPLLEAMN
jgi:hypothetical protein